MPKKIIWAPLAENDLSEILEYLNSNWETKVAANFIDLTENVIEQLAINPNQYPIIFKKGKIRKCVITKHNSLFYRDLKSQIEILRIYDTRQDPDSLKF